MGILHNDTLAETPTDPKLLSRQLNQFCAKAEKWTHSRIYVAETSTEQLSKEANHKQKFKFIDVC